MRCKTFSFGTVVWSLEQAWEGMLSVVVTDFLATWAYFITRVKPPVSDDDFQAGYLSCLIWVQTIYSEIFKVYSTKWGPFETQYCGLVLSVENPSLFYLFFFSFFLSYRYPQIFVDQQNVCNMQDDVEAIIGDTVSSSSFGGSSISLPSRRRRSKARFGDKNLIKWMSYHKFWGYIFDYFILVPGRIICKCVCMYI